MKMTKSLSKLCAAVLMFGVFGVASAAQYTMKMGTSTLNDVQHEWMKRFAKEIDTATEGQIKVEIYPASQLGSSQKTIEQVQFNSAQGWVGAAEFLSGVDSRFAMLSAPGVFRDMDHVTKVIIDEGFYDELMKIGANKGVLGLGIMLSGPTSFVSNEPIKSLEDFKGMKTRVTASAIQMEQIKAMGAAPVPMSLGEVLPALQQGALDGVMSNAAIFASLKYYSTVKHQLLTDQSMFIAYVGMSKLWYESLPEDLQKTVLETGRKVSLEITDFAKSEVKRSEQEWKDNGGVIDRLPEADQKALFELLRPVGEEVASRKESDKKFFELMTSVADKY